MKFSNVLHRKTKWPVDNSTQSGDYFTNDIIADS